MTDAAGELEFANAEARAVLAAGSHEVAASRWREVSTSLRLHRPGAAQTVSRHLAELKVDGSERSLRVEMHALPPPRGGHLVLIRDRRARDALETDLLLASQMRSLGHVYRVMAHDLKSPLNSMQLSLELLEDSCGEPDAGRISPSRGRGPRHISILREELARLNRILQSMLEPREPLGEEPQVFDLRDALAEIARLLAPQARRQRVELDARLPEGPARVRGHRDRIRQALLNLAVSGLDFIGAGGRLRIGLAVHGTVQVAIECGPPGLPERLLDEMFRNHFVGTDGDASGLYAARLAVESGAGQLEAGPTGDGGTLFDVRLPLAAP